MYKFTHAIILSREEYNTIMKVDGCLDWDKILFDDFITHALIAEHFGSTTCVNIGQTTETTIVDQIDGFLNGISYVLFPYQYEKHRAIYVYDIEDYVDILDQYQEGKAVWQD